MLLAVVEADAQAGAAQVVRRRARGGEHLRSVLLADDRHDHGLVRRDGGWQAQPCVVAVGHDEAADEPCARPPGGRVGVLLASVPACEGDAEGARKALTEVVRRGRLERLPVTHQRLEGVRLDGTGEALARALAAS